MLFLDCLELPICARCCDVDGLLEDRSHGLVDQCTATSEKTDLTCSGILLHRVPSHKPSSDEVTPAGEHSMSLCFHAHIAVSLLTLPLAVLQMLDIAMNCEEPPDWRTLWIYMDTCENKKGTRVRCGPELRSAWGSFWSWRDVRRKLMRRQQASQSPPRPPCPSPRLSLPARLPSTSSRRGSSS